MVRSSWRKTMMIEKCLLYGKKVKKSQKSEVRMKK